MLAVTPNAAEAINAIVSSTDLPEGAGLRITRESSEDETGQTRTDLRLSPAEAPEGEDTVIPGGHVFIEPETAEMLDDKLLDAEIEGNEVQFTLREQAGAEEGE
jgi:iron-sulfur cluster assembly protein